MMKERERVWVSLGLLLTNHPRMKGHLDPSSVKIEELRNDWKEGLQKALSLRHQDGGDIFSGNFPEWADREICAAGKAGVAIVTWEDTGYPARLRNLPDPPPFLYVRGDLAACDSDAVAIVGSRKATPYGVYVAGQIGRDLATFGLTVVSGLARGIDSAAHRGALAAGGRTVGVLGSGMDVVYPKENRRLFCEVPGAGALVTEYPFGAAPKSHHFPVRNRIIAGLSAAVVVVEAARDSGSLITARLAADELGLPVCAVPGPITSKTSAGCNDMIYDGATPVRDVQDILDLLPEDVRQRAAQRREITQASGQSGEDGLGPDLEEGARRVLRSLAPDIPKSADDLARTTRLASGVLLGHLLDLEIRGLAEQLPGGLFVSKI